MPRSSKSVSPVGFVTVLWFAATSDSNRIAGSTDKPVNFDSIDSLESFPRRLGQRRFEFF